MKRPPRLLVIDPSIRHPEEEGVAEILKGWSADAQIVRPGLEPATGLKPGDSYDFDGIVLLGSAASVHDDHSWLKNLSGWLRPIIAGKTIIPLLGICFGHQLIAHLAGGRIGWARDDHEKVLGVVESGLEGGRLVPGQHRFVVIASHREAVLEIPIVYTVTARRPLAPIDGMEHLELPTFSFQFHAEAGPQFLAQRGIDPDQVDPAAFSDGRRIIDAFRRFVLSRFGSKA